MPGRDDIGATPEAVWIQERAIGDGRPVFIVAEAGVNHNGCEKTAVRLIDAAVDAGADAVKFQVFRASELVTAAAPTAAYQKRGGGRSSQRAMLAELELSDDAFRRISEYCTNRGVVFLGTPFSPSDVERLVSFRAAAIKIASTDLANGALLDAACGTGSALILSTGASTVDEIESAVGRVRGAGAPLILLHCVSCYPTPMESINLRAIGELARGFCVPCGLSDHTLSTETGGWAVAVGAVVLEKHLTLDRAADGPDHAMSLDPAGFSEYVSAVRRVEGALGSGRLGMIEPEADVRRVARRSVVAARRIASGLRLTAEMLTLKRPGDGIPPDKLDALVGRTAVVDIAGDTLLSWDMVE